jgi:hypothetical protein
MPEAFDPYHKWLGIPPSEQPANHYRLLGVVVFEADADVIDSAANQRMAYLQDMATGPQVDESQRILNEISAARLCLLNPKRRAEYDDQLRQDLAAEQPDEGSAGQAQAQGLSPMVLVSGVSVGLITLTIALIMIFKGGDAAEDVKKGTLLVTWKVSEREGAYVMIGSKIVIDSKTKKLPKEEIVSFQVVPKAKRIEFTFERRGYRPINFKYKFIPGEVVDLGLNWRSVR